MRDEEEEPRRPEVRTSRQEEEKVDKHQEQLQQQAEMKRCFKSVQCRDNDCYIVTCSRIQRTINAGKARVGNDAL